MAWLLQANERVDCGRCLHFFLSHICESHQFRIRVLDVDLARRRIDLSMRSSESSTISARFATLQKLKNEIFPARVISMEDHMGLTNVVKCYTGDEIDRL